MIPVYQWPVKWYFVGVFCPARIRSTRMTSLECHSHSNLSLVFISIIFIIFHWHYWYSLIFLAPRLDNPSNKLIFSGNVLFSLNMFCKPFGNCFWRNSLRHSAVLGLTAVRTTQGGEGVAWCVHLKSLIHKTCLFNGVCVCSMKCGFNLPETSLQQIVI